MILSASEARAIMRRETAFIVGVRKILQRQELAEAVQIDLPFPGDAEQFDLPVVVPRSVGRPRLRYLPCDEYFTF